jgi:hypothetical protein
MKKSAHSYLLYQLTSYVLAEKVGYGRYFCKRVIGNLRAGRVVLPVLRVPWCHARVLNAQARITFHWDDGQTATVTRNEGSSFHLGLESTMLC